VAGLRGSHRGRMPARARPPAAPLASRPVNRVTALEFESPGRLRGPAFQRLARGAYRARDGVVDHGRRIEAFRSVLGRDAVLGGPSAAWALGVRFAAPEDDVEVVLPAAHRARSRAYLRVRGDALAAGEVVRTGLGPVTSPARTAFDLARRGRPEHALGWVDAILRTTGIAAATAQAVLAAHPGVRGVRQADAVIAAADPRAESPRESMLRWLLLDGDLPAPVPQYVVRDRRGGFVGRLDLAWPDARIAVEYDGDHHRERLQHSRDLRRHNDLRALGWTVIQVDAAALRDSDRLLALLRQLLAGAYPASATADISSTPPPTTSSPTPKNGT
jgi:hypothetical protein